MGRGSAVYAGAPSSGQTGHRSGEGPWLPQWRISAVLALLGVYRRNNEGWGKILHHQQHSLDMAWGATALNVASGDPDRMVPLHVQYITKPAAYRCSIRLERGPKWNTSCHGIDSLP